MTGDEALYSLSVESVQNRRQLVQMVGSRETLLEVAVRVMLDCSPAWDQPMTPTFTVTILKVRA